MKSLLQRLLLTLLFAGFSSLVLSDSQTFGNYTVHYIAVNSTFIDADIARQYDLVRGKRNAFLNVSVLRNNDDGSTTPVLATVNGDKRNLMSQRGNIDFREIREGVSIYYIGQFEFSNAELLRFTITVQPENRDVAQEIEWEATLYATE